HRPERPLEFRPGNDCNGWSPVVGWDIRTNVGILISHPAAPDTEQTFDTHSMNDRLSAKAEVDI
ncbi:MAG: hypothetical protein GY792_18465, partial [Gammaproteobacteria bacterium]|nr:hypothetical protein [Gammaproteobacteria bacterium]